MPPPNRACTASVVLGLLILPTTAACGHSAGDTPPGITEHQPGTHATPAAARKGGACTLHDATAITAAFNADAATAQPDTFTAEVNRCDWTVEGSPLGEQLHLAIQIVRGPKSQAAAQRGSGSQTVGAGDLTGVYTPSSHTLTVRADAQSQVTYQLTDRAFSVPQRRLRAALVRLASTSP